MRLLRLASICLAISVTPMFGATPEHNTKDLKTTIERLHDQWLQAFDSQDGETMERLEVPNFVLVNVDDKGTIWQKKRSRVGDVGHNGVTSRELRDCQVRQFGDTAILTGIQTAKTPDKTYTWSTTEVWVRQSGQWRIASAQISDVVK